jgi:hypothetical protein
MLHVLVWDGKPVCDKRDVAEGLICAGLIQADEDDFGHHPAVSKVPVADVTDKSHELEQLLISLEATLEEGLLIEFVEVVGVQVYDLLP